MSHLKEILFLLVVVKDIESKECQALDAPLFMMYVIMVIISEVYKKVPELL